TISSGGREAGRDVRHGVARHFCTTQRLSDRHSDGGAVGCGIDRSVSQKRSAHSDNYTSADQTCCLERADHSAAVNIYQLVNRLGSAVLPGLLLLVGAAVPF